MTLLTHIKGEHLQGLISAAKATGIDFYYALSPGLDITYCSLKDTASLKRKLDQVSQFGCGKSVNLHIYIFKIQILSRTFCTTL